MELVKKAAFCDRSESGYLCCLTEPVLLFLLLFPTNPRDRQAWRQNRGLENCPWTTRAATKLMFSRRQRQKRARKWNRRRSCVTVTRVT
ncbi:hypothetical protein HA466_0168550 [Hirschfeldia incana]|nr:hypothetical protein HA466_0168550 [Hirschfeldia incana]